MKDYEMAEEALEELGILKLAKRPYTELSGGREAAGDNRKGDGAETGYYYIR